MKNVILIPLKARVPYNSIFVPPIIRYFGFIFLASVSFFCAGQYAPPGGPVDKVPLEVVATSPAPGTLRFHGDKIRIEFNKYITPLRVQQAVFVSPSLGQLEYDWGWKDVVISFSDSLRPNTTYIFTLGTDAQDSHGNSLTQAFALPFSTGDKIDSASVTGRVFDQNPSGIMIFAYKLHGRAPDTLNPTHTKPDFLTQTGKDGSFALTNLDTGSYRMIAVRDQYRNLLYDVQADDYGVLPSDLALPVPKSSIADVQFKMTAADTSRPFLSSAKALNRTEILLRFSKPVDPGSVNTAVLSVVDTLSKKSLDVHDLSFSESGLEASLVTADQDSPGVYMVKVSSARDLHGNAIADTGGKAFFGASARPDTLKPTIKFLSGADSLKNIDPEDTLWVTLTKPVIREKLEQAIHLYDSTKTQIPARLEWKNSLHAVLVPSHLLYGAWYRLTIVLDSLRDYGGKGYHDSILVRRFLTMSDQVLGSVSGVMFDERSNEPGRIILTMREILSKDIPVKVLTLDSVGGFSFEHVREGKYSLWAYRDRDKKGGYVFGDVFPYIPSERFAIYPDTLKVRARWPLEGVQLRLKKF